ncbi:hypothetical protein WA016_07971 [Myxococcus stipitatus]
MPVRGRGPAKACCAWLESSLTARGKAQGYDAGSKETAGRTR